ncbi:MAG: hypothetical protein LH624_06975, partial [Cryobacterium sp.]|nr:hypothetical protein [Cryobacterium sp.]
TDNGYTNLADGVLLCHPHHLLLHNQHWTILRTETQYWLKPPTDLDPKQTLIALPGKGVVGVTTGSTTAGETTQR